MIKNILLIGAIALALSGCEYARKAFTFGTPYAAIGAAESYNDYCSLATKEQRIEFRDAMQKELDKLGTGRVVPKFDCNNDGVPDVDQ